MTIVHLKDRSGYPVCGAPGNVEVRWGRENVTCPACLEGHASEAGSSVPAMNPTPRRTAVVVLSEAQLRYLLHIPEDVTIRGGWANADPFSVEVVLEGDRFAEVEEYAASPRINLHTVSDAYDGKVWRHVDWDRSAPPVGPVG